MAQTTKKNSIKEVKKENTLIRVLKWIRNNIKFLLIPFSTTDELSEKVYEYEKTKSQRKFFKRLLSPLTIIGIVIIFGIVSLAVFGAWIAPYTYYDCSIPTYPGVYELPSPGHILGQNELGQDVFSRVIYGARSSLTVALPSIFFSVFFGIIIGTISGYFGGIIDSIIMRILDIFLAFPTIILALAFIAIAGEVRMEIIMLAYGLLGIPFYSRLIRGSVLQARELPYIQAAKASGSSNFGIMFKHIIPNVIQPILIAFTFNIGGIILSLAGLAFLGYRDPSLIEWGNDISVARLHLIPPENYWAALGPGIMIFLTVMGFMLLGDGLRDALDPKMKNL